MTVEMPVGALLLWEGALWHRGGGNSTADEYRRSINVNFNLAWLKQRENQFIGVPPEVVVEMPEKLQALIGYKLTNFGLGTVDYRNPIETVKRRLAEGSNGPPASFRRGVGPARDLVTGPCHTPHRCGYPPTQMGLDQTNPSLAWVART